MAYPASLTNAFCILSLLCFDAIPFAGVCVSIVCEHMTQNGVTVTSYINIYSILWCLCVPQYVNAKATQQPLFTYAVKQDGL